MWYILYLYAIIQDGYAHPTKEEVIDQSTLTKFRKLRLQDTELLYMLIYHILITR